MATRGAGVDELVAELRDAHANGGAVFGHVRLVVDPVLHWFGSRNRWDEIPFVDVL